MRALFWRAQAFAPHFPVCNCMRLDIFERAHSGLSLRDGLGPGRALMPRARSPCASDLAQGRHVAGALRLACCGLVLLLHHFAWRRRRRPAPTSKTQNARAPTRCGARDARRKRRRVACLRRCGRRARGARASRGACTALK